MRVNLPETKGSSVFESAITPRYADLFNGMLDPDRMHADQAFDAVLFERHLAVPALIEQYEKSPDNEIMRYLCVQLLGFSDSQKAINALIVALDDTSAMVRREACFALEDLKAVKAIDAIERRKQDMDSSVRQVAEEAFNFLSRKK